MNMLEHKDYCTLLQNTEDQDILTRRLFNVNMRLFEASKYYKNIILQVCNYLQWCAQTEKTGYKKPHGFSGANAGIPFNIVALADGTVMINPTIIFRSEETRESLSNCGSLLLAKPIRIVRHAHIVVRYFDVDGKPKQISGYLPTVQHEIDHNNGILIIDRRL